MYQLAFSKKKNSTKVTEINKSNIIDHNIFSHFSLLFWEEHCVECVAQDGYNSCTLHGKRPDGGCASLVNGFENIKKSSTIDGFSVHTEFNKWAKIETQWPYKPSMYKAYLYKIFSFVFHSIDKIFASLPKFYKSSKNKNLKSYEIWRSYSYRLFKYIADNNKSNVAPDYLLLQIENLSQRNHSNLQIEILSDKKISYRNNLLLNKTINTFFIGFEELSFGFKEESLFRIWSDDLMPPNLIIHWAHLVKLKDKEKQPELYKNDLIKKKIEKLKNKKIKCVVFDLDNTLWDGIVGDDETSKIVLKKNVLEFIHKLDERGIICSIASKNEYSIAWKKLIELKIEDYFVYPEIHWGEKYNSIKNISKNMNIGTDAMAFIDDSPYERRAINNFLPEVRIFEEISDDLINKEEFDVLVTGEGKNRRKFYLSDDLRKKDKELYNADNLSFLKSCDMKINLLESSKNITRCTELIQRTNQFNISKYKFNKAELNSHLNQNDSFCWELKDKYGDYGIVGFLSYKINSKVIEISEFTMSCRAAARYVEESLFAWFNKSFSNSINTIKIKFYKTQRNNPIYEKLQQIGFKTTGKKNDQEDLILEFNEYKQHPDVIEITDNR